MSKRRRKALSVFILLMMTVLACTCLPTKLGEETPEPVRRDTPPPPPPGILFQDDFSDTGSGWEVGEYEGGNVGYKSGVYFVTALGESIIWGVANQSFDNVIVDVDATQVSAGPAADNDYGVICRSQPDSLDGYHFVTSGDGYYAIAKAVDEEFEPLVDFTESGAIRQGNATNHIRAICDGPTLALFVNGERLATVEDSTFTRGDIALAATSYEEEPTEIHFDNLVVRKP